MYLQVCFPSKGLCELWGHWLDYTPTPPNWDVAEIIFLIGYIVMALVLVGSYESSYLTLEDKTGNISIMGQISLFYPGEAEF